jgi:hypothetical protein
MVRDARRLGENEISVQCTMEETRGKDIEL